MTKHSQLKMDPLLKRPWSNFDTCRDDMDAPDFKPTYEKRWYDI